MGVVGALKRVSENDDELKAGVGGDGEVEVTAGEAVNFVDDEDSRGTEEGHFVRGDSPVLGRVFDAKMFLFPFGAKLAARNSDAGVFEEAEGADGVGERSSFAAAGETGEVDELDGTLPEGVGGLVEGEDAVDERFAVGLGETMEDTIVAVAEVGGEVREVAWGGGEGV